MKITILAIGKRHDADIAAAVNDYTTRLQRYAKTDWQLIPSPKSNMSPGEQRAHESRAIMQALKPDCAVILLDERGTQFAVPNFADKLQEMRQLYGHIVFVIGGAHGVTDELRARATFVWSLSRLVFPHQIVRLMLAEQLYRAFTVVQGEPYHHA